MFDNSNGNGNGNGHGKPIGWAPVPNVAARGLIPASTNIFLDLQNSANALLDVLTKGGVQGAPARLSPDGVIGPKTTEVVSWLLGQTRAEKPSTIPDIVRTSAVVTQYAVPLAAHFKDMAAKAAKPAPVRLPPVEVTPTGTVAQRPTPIVNIPRAPAPAPKSNTLAWVLGGLGVVAGAGLITWLATRNSDRGYDRS